jgi:MFS transporter, SP family, sugar:H+ symporter
MTNWLWNGIIAFCFPILFAAVGKYVFFLFGGCCVLMFVWALFCIPETKGKTLEEIDEVFGDNLAIQEREIQDVFEKKI